MKTVLDACCGSRMMWFQPNHPAAIFMDIRSEEFTIHSKRINVNPDVIGDYKKMPFEDETFYLVVFDPPHLRWAGNNSIMKAQYGQLSDTWREDIKAGFDECVRVLKPNGTLVFKWSDAQINVNEVLRLIDHKPLFGQRRGKTHWMVFYKVGDTL